jgi:hypothetical protein
MSFKDTNSDAPNNLTQDEATVRATQISNVSYEIKLTLTSGSPTYQGRVVVQFDFAHNPSSQPVFFDFVGNEITELVVNGKKATGDPFKGGSFLSFLTAQDTVLSLATLFNKAKILAP